MKHITLSIMALLLLFIQCKQETNKIQTSKNQDQEWQSLFNGKDLSGWVPKFYHEELGVNYLNTFQVDNGILKVKYDQYDKFDEHFGHLFYEKPFSSFHLKCSYRFTDQYMADAPEWTYLNSGIMFHSQAPNTILKEQDWPISIECQLLAGERIEDGVTTGNMCSPGTDIDYQNQPYPQHCLNSQSKIYPWNEWVQAELVVYKDSLVQHLINGEVVLEYTAPRIGGGTVSGHNPVIKQDGKPLTSGYIALQAEGNGIEFKDILIKEL